MSFTTSRSCGIGRSRRERSISQARQNRRAVRFSLDNFEFSVCSRIPPYIHLNCRVWQKLVGLPGRLPGLGVDINNVIGWQRRAGDGWKRELETVSRRRAKETTGTDDGAFVVVVVVVASTMKAKIIKPRSSLPRFLRWWHCLGYLAVIVPGMRISNGKSERGYKEGRRT